MMKKFTIILIALVALSSMKLSAQGCGGPVSDEGLKMFGFAQAQYEYKMEDPTNKNSFTFERVRIGAQGAIPYDFSYYVVLELSPFIAPNPYLLDAFISYNRFDWARVSLGSFKTPFGLETNTACNGLITVNRSTATLQMVAPFRDLGMVFMGGNENTFMTYQLGIMNGSGLGRSDNNTKKDIVGRVVFKPFEQLKVGGSFRYGYPSLNNTKDSRTTFGVELQGKVENFTLMGEYIMDEGDYNRDLGGGCSGNLIELGKERSGGYVTASYNFDNIKLEPVVKFDFFDSGNSAKYKETNITVGLNYNFNDWTRLQANYVYRAEEPIEMTNDEFVLQLQVKF